MRKKLFTLSVILIVLAAFCVALSACTDAEEEGNSLKFLTVESSRDGAYILGETVVLSEIVLKAEYADGEVRSIHVDDTMLSDDDRNKFFIHGVHSVTINYGGKQVVLQISVETPKEETLYTARFFSNGGSEVEPRTARVITEFRAPNRIGYTFGGWYTTYDFSGSRAVAPYTLTQDTDFYAKWIDNRRCNVKFMDGDAVLYEFDVVYGTSIDIADLETYPAPEEKEGKIFKGWTLASGSTDDIRMDTVIAAGYESVKCTVQIEYWDGEKIVNKPITLNYGETFDVGEYEMPTKDGHTSRWVIYRDGASAFEEMPEGTEVITVTEALRIEAHHVINTYTVTIHNGAAAQTYDNLKQGSIELERVYADGAALADYKVDYNGNFLFSNFIQEPYLKDPYEIEGYNAVWCFVTSTATGEIWRNARNDIWDEASGAFIAAGESTSNFDLTDRDGNYIARVVSGDLREVRGNVTVKAKYYKKDYSVRLLRRVGTDWQTVNSFTEKYLADFRLYDPSKYDGALNLYTPQDVESYYYLHNVARWSKDTGIAELWASLYSNGGNDDDWDVEWYYNSGMSDETLVDFAEINGRLGSWEITGDLTLYAKDIDLRRYSVTLLYDYDFANGEYRQITEYPELTENQLLEKPSASENSIIRRYDAYGANITYEFAGWYDFPYEPDGNGCTGNYYPSLETRNRNMFYYAHYKCETTYTVTVYDKTQRVAYEGTSYDGKGFDVPENTVVYTVDAGTLFTLDMLYKGRVNPDGSFVSGQYYYDRAAFVEYVLGDGGKDSPNGSLFERYQELLVKYDRSGDHATALSALNAAISEKQAKADDYLSLLNKLYIYDYTIGGGAMDAESFRAVYLTLADYHDLRREIKDLENERELIENFADNLALAKSYYDENEAHAAEGGLYKRYGDSLRDLNLAYGFDIAESKYKYKFGGWYVDSTYSTPYDPGSREMDFSWFASGGNLTLYAKWADEEKGSEGLVFKKIIDADGNILGLAVADYMNRADYEASDIYGCGYNDFDRFEYSVSYNDQDVMPSELGRDVDVQIPAYHGGTNAAGIPVIGILSGAFRRNGSVIRSVSLPADIAFIEEGAFINCSLVSISGTDNEYLAVQDERAVYQKSDYVAYHNIGTDKKEVETSENTLIYYTGGAENISVSLREGTARVAEYAFYGAVRLSYVDFGMALASIGKSAFENSALRGTSAETFEDSLVLPDTLVSIGENAFKNCAFISDFVLTASSSLNSVGKDALSTTKWYTSKNGVITLNGLAVGVRGADENSFDRENGSLKITEGRDGRNKYTYTNVDGVLYYDAETRTLTEILLKSSVEGIADYALSGAVSGAAAVIILEGQLDRGIARYAFANCVNLTDVYASALSSACTVDGTAFYGCSRPTVRVTDPNALHQSWRDCPNMTLSAA